ncbi:MAG: threonylcarbamoyl-AMP synthase [Bacteroidaceae bacterium]|nr:threonylcarbamoyl-AMP synthase [Bacteroidaceae bacterium]
MLIKLYDKNNDQRDIDQIVQVLRDGGTIIYPTDTAYALGCHALKERPIEKICRLKGLNPGKHRFSIVCYDLSDISQYVRVDNATFKLMKRNLPGPFTFILQAGSRLPKIFSNRKEVGIRVPDNPITRELCRQLEAPLMTTTIPYDESEDIEYLTDPELIAEKFEKDVDIVIDGGPGGFEYSTVVNCINGEPEIVRQGKGILDEY